MASKTKTNKDEQKKNDKKSVPLKNKDVNETKVKKTPSKIDDKPLKKSEVKTKSSGKEPKTTGTANDQKKTVSGTKSEKPSSKKIEPKKAPANLKTKDNSKSSKPVESKKTKVEKPVETAKAVEKERINKAKPKSESKVNESIKEKEEKKSKKSIKPEVKVEEKKPTSKEKPKVQTKEQTQQISDTPAPRESVVTEKPKPAVRYSDEDLEMFKMKILEVRKEAIEELGMLKERLEDLTNYDFAEESMIYSMHMAEQGSEAMEKEKTYAQIQRINEYIKKLDEALQRIADKTYGICRECGILIAKERLLAVPITTLSASWKIRKVCPEDGIDRIEPLK